MMPAWLDQTAEAESIMKQSVFYLRHPVIAIGIAGICTLASVNLEAKEIQVGRYSLLMATPTEAQAELLATTMTVQFPARIRSVGEAVRYLLQRSGYRLASVEATHPHTLALLALPLPAVHRTLGPMTLRDTLKTLAGPAFHLVEDPVHRLVTFERCAVDQLAVEDETAIDKEIARHDD